MSILSASLNARLAASSAGGSAGRPNLEASDCPDALAAERDDEQAERAVEVRSGVALLRAHDRTAPLGRPDLPATAPLALRPDIFSRVSGTALSPEQVELQHRLHRHRIDLADEVLVVNPNGYVGESTAGEIEVRPSTRKADSLACRMPPTVALPSVRRVLAGARLEPAPPPERPEPASSSTSYNGREAAPRAQPAPAVADRCRFRRCRGGQGERVPDAEEIA